MTTPDHITLIIERLDPVDREALEQHLKDKSIMGDLMCLQEIRQAIGDPHGKLMQDEMVDKIKDLVQQNASLLGTIKCLQSLRDRAGNDLDCALRGDAVSDSWFESDRLLRVVSLAQGRAAMRAERDDLTFQIAYLKSTLQLCADTFRRYEQIHAAKPDPVKAEQNAWFAEQAERAIALPPTACVAEARAQAVLEFANSVQRDSIHSPTLKALAKHHAEQLRKEAQ